MCLGLAVLGIDAGLDLAAERPRPELTAVADAEDRDAEIKELRADMRGCGIIDAVRSAGEDDTGRVQCPDLLYGCLLALDLAVDTALAHAACDELVVLTAEVENDD